jgi:hypothetical protein
MRIFLAGLMQGSHLALVVHNQDWRAQLRELLSTHLPDAKVYDPWDDHSNSVDYDDVRGKQVFLHHNQLCREVDCVLAFVPQASMGTAIEMWEGHQAGRAVIAVSPLIHNWAVKFLSDAVYPDVAAFEAALADGRVEAIIRRKLNR